MVALILGYNGSIEDGERVLAPARAFGSPIVDMVGPMPYLMRQTMLDEPAAPGTAGAALFVEHTRHGLSAGLAGRGIGPPALLPHPLPDATAERRVWGWDTTDAIQRKLLQDDTLKAWRLAFNGTAAGLERKSQLRFLVLI